MRGWPRSSVGRRSDERVSVQWEDVLGTGLILSATQFPYERRQRRRVSTTIPAALNRRSSIYWSDATVRRGRSGSIESPNIGPLGTGVAQYGHACQIASRGAPHPEQACLSRVVQI